MREAGVTIVSLGIFSWARIQPGPDAWDFAWLDEVMDLLHEHGVGVDLGDRHRLPAALADHRAPRDPPGHRPGRDAVAGSAPALAPDLARLPRARPAPGPEAGHPLRRPPGARRLARQQRAGLPQRLRLPRRRGPRLPGLAARAVRHDGRPQPRLGHGVLVAALRRLGGDPAAPAGRLAPEPDPAAGLQALLLGRAARTTCARSGTCCGS